MSKGRPGRTARQAAAWKITTTDKREGSEEQGRTNFGVILVENE